MDKHLDQLEALLGQLDAEHEQMLTLLAVKREAMRQAKPAAVSDCCERENERVQKIVAIEKRRQVIVGEITAALTPGAAQPLTITQIADRVGEPRRGRLLVLRQRVRDRMHRVARENAVARAATDGLLRHVQGLIQQVSKTLAGSGTYGRAGMNPAASTITTTFSITG